jgi:multidrug efflux system membrane fusion protein
MFQKSLFPHRQAAAPAAARPKTLLRHLPWALGCALLAGCGKPETAPKRAMIVPVRAATAIQTNVPVQVLTFGQGEAFATVSIKPLVTGQLMEILFSEGQDVQAGSPLFKIDPRSFEAAIKQSEAMLARDLALAENATQEARRAEELLKTESVPQRQYDSAKAAEAAAKAAVASDRAALENARLQLEYCSIKAPINARAGNYLVNQGNVVKANDTALVILNQISPLYVEFSVPEQYLHDIQVNQARSPLAVQVVIPGREPAQEQGRLEFIDNAVEAGTIKLKARFENQARNLWPGQFVNVSLTLSTQTNAILIPSEAVESGQKGQYVFVIKPDQTVAYRPVVAGRFAGESLVIDQGLQPGELVAVDGQLQLVEGTKVEIKREEAKAATPTKAQP